MLSSALPKRPLHPVHEILVAVTDPRLGGILAQFSQDLLLCGALHALQTHEFRKLGFRGRLPEQLEARYEPTVRHTKQLQQQLDTREFLQRVARVERRWRRHLNVFFFFFFC